VTVDDVVGVDTEVGERIVAMSTAEQRRGDGVIGVGRQSTAASTIRRHQVRRPRRTDVREPIVQPLRAVVHPAAANTRCNNDIYLLKLEFHGTDTDTDTDIR